MKWYSFVFFNYSVYLPFHISSTELSKVTQNHPSFFKSLGQGHGGWGGWTVSQEAQGTQLGFYLGWTPVHCGGAHSHTLRAIKKDPLPNCMFLDQMRKSEDLEEKCVSQGEHDAQDALSIRTAEVGFEPPTLKVQGHGATH